MILHTLKSTYYTLCAGIQYFCESMTIEKVNPTVLNELVWFETPDPVRILDQQDEAAEERRRREKYIYISNLINSSKFLWYEK